MKPPAESAVRGRGRALAAFVLLAAALASSGCAPPPNPATPLAGDALPVVRPMGVREVSPTLDAQPGPADYAFAAVGTPFFLGYKAIRCVGSVAIAAPVALVAVPTVDLPGNVVRRTLGAGIAQNCGGPYILDPVPR